MFMLPMSTVPKNVALLPVRLESDTTSVPVTLVALIKRRVPGPHRLLSVRTPVHRKCG